MNARPARKTAVLTCMDARIDPLAVLGLELGDAHVIRNAGAVVTDEEIRSLALSQHALGTEDVVVIAHTECGVLGLDDEAFAAELEAAAGRRPDWRAHGFADLDEHVRAGVARIAGSPFLRHRDRVRGYVLDVATGELRQVV